MQLLSVGMVDKNRSVGSMVVAVLVYIGLHLPEVREDLLEAPQVISQCRPAVEIIWNSPVERRRIDGTGTTGDLPSWH